MDNKLQPVYYTDLPGIILYKPLLCQTVRSLLLLVGKEFVSDYRYQTAEISSYCKAADCYENLSGFLDQ